MIHDSSEMRLYDFQHAAKAIECCEAQLSRIANSLFVPKTLQDQLQNGSFNLIAASMRARRGFTLRFAEGRRRDRFENFLDGGVLYFDRAIGFAVMLSVNLQRLANGLLGTACIKCLEPQGVAEQIRYACAKTVQARKRIFS